MTLADITRQEPWEKFQASQPCAQFLQSWAWGEFRLAEVPVHRFALIDENGTWLAALQMERQHRRFGIAYWFAPRGPVFSSHLSADDKRQVMMTLCEELLKHPELRRKTLFWRFEPVSELADPEGLMPMSFRRSPSLNPASTILLDLQPTEDELFKALHEKTRYNVRVAERRGVRCRVAQTEQDVDAFLDLMDETAARDGFVQRSRKYLRATYDALHPLNLVKIRLAEFSGKVLAANLEVAYGDTVTYLYGASSSSERNVMAPYLLHWQAIQEAKLLGFTRYDFWGANPESKAGFYYKPSWEGITRFKRGWGGRQVDFVGTWNLPFNGLFYRLAFPKQFFRE